MKKQIHIIAAAAMLAVAPALHAQTPTTPSEPNSGQNLVATRIASNFTSLAGTEQNALTLVNALRAGTNATLVTVVPPPAGSPAGTPSTTTQTTVEVPTKPMGWGNVKHALALAQDQLARAGITDPTAAQLQTALTGGDLVVTNADGTTTTTTVKGVLTMRADGMGWGNIAKAGGTTLGAVTSKVDMSARSIKAPTTATGTSTTTTANTTLTKANSAKGLTTASGVAPSQAAKGITTAAGAPAASNGQGPSKGITTATGATSTHGSRGLVTASGASANASPQGNAYGRGIVTAAGGGSANVAATGVGKGGGAGAGAGLVTAGGGSVSSSGVTNAHGGNPNAGGGNDKAGGNGKGKGG